MDRGCPTEGVTVTPAELEQDVDERTTFEVVLLKDVYDSSPRALANAANSIVVSSQCEPERGAVSTLECLPHPIGGPSRGLVS